MTEKQTHSKDENSLVTQRREKLATIRSQGIAFPNDFKPQNYAYALQVDYSERDKPWFNDHVIPVSIAGRMMLKRVMVKPALPPCRI